ncbi:DUF6344 domain-containing protein [Streptomyces sp. NPDC056975]|uniref:DUF6344 domain-containing protein n=1 Tax=unclassified Streptomyces TaxID=2593676 RepID=UPI0036425760
MATNKVIKLWTVLITAFLAVLTAMGLTSPAAAAAPVQQSEGTRNAAVNTPAVTAVRSPWAFKRSLPPTMKQRIRAEAHGSSPSSRHRPPAGTESASEFDETAAGINALHSQS